MIKKIIPFLFVISLAISCSDEKKENLNSAVDVGRAFIRATLDGDLATAEKLILKDSQNLQLFDSYKSYYEKLPQEKKKHYREAGYNINKYVSENDSTTIINYSNDYMNTAQEIRVVRQDNEWKVDFNYIKSGNLPTDQ